MVYDPILDNCYDKPEKANVYLLHINEAKLLTEFLDHEYISYNNLELIDLVRRINRFVVENSEK